jgi:hypothetical protein
LLRQANVAGVTGVYVSPRGQGETKGDEHLICTDNVLLGDPILGQRAYDIAAASRAVRRLPGMEEVPIALFAVGPEAGLSGLFAQGMWMDFDTAAVGPVMASYLDAFGADIPLMAYVANILHVADIPHVAALAAERPLMLATRETSAEKWWKHLRGQATLTSELQAEDAFEWLDSRAR